MLISSTLPNRANAGFEPTPERIAAIITHSILDLNPIRLKEGEAFTMLEPCIGRGDLAAPVATLPQTKLVGIEQDPARAAHTRARFPQATILTADLGTVRISPACFSLALCNFPYGHDALLGGRLEYQMLKQVTETLLPGGVLVTIVPARSGWDNRSIRYMGTHYQSIQAWRFFGESAQAAERFSTFTQIVVVAIKRPVPLLRVPDDLRATLNGWRWDAERGWAGVAPEALPATPIPARYLVPGTICQPAWTLTSASDDELLASLRASGVHTTAAWADATTWQAQAIVPNPLMAYAGTSHIVGGLLTGFLDGQMLWDADRVPWVFSAFQSKERVTIELDPEVLQDVREHGALAVTVYETTNVPMIGALNLHTGETTFVKGEPVYSLLKPWMQILAAEVIAHRPPLYQPAAVQPWQLRLATVIGADKQLPGAPHPGLTATQLHMSCALAVGLNELGHAAVQGAPGTGKTRQLIMTAAQQAYHWRHRRSNIRRVVDADSGVTYELIDTNKVLSSDEVAAFVGYQSHAPTAVGSCWINARQPAWIKRLRAAWKHNPFTTSDEPRALPIIVAAPKRVVTSAWESEIKGAFPTAEVIHIEQRVDLLRFFARCAVSPAPAIFGIIPHSLTRTFTANVVPDVQRDYLSNLVNDLSDAARERGEPITDDAGNLTGYIDRTTHQLITTWEQIEVYRCRSCNQLITAPIPFAEDPDQEGPVEAIEWFERQKRWCTNLIPVSANRDPQTGRALGEPLTRSCGAPHWTTARTTTDPTQIGFGAWYRATEHWRNTIARGQWWPQPATSASRIIQTEAGRFTTAAIPDDTASPFVALHRDFAGCVALTIIDESHNAMGENTDIARSLHYAQLAAQTYLYASGTHYAGTLDRFYFYWHRFDPGFWRQFGFGWRDAAAAAQAFGIIQTWIKEYPAPANKGTGAQTRTSVNSVLAPGIDAALFPYLLSTMGFITIQDIGALMPEKHEFPRLVDMHDPILATLRSRMRADRSAAEDRLPSREQHDAQQRLSHWIEQRDLATAYASVVDRLEQLADDGVQAAVLGKGTIPRWYPALCCEAPAFTLTRQRRTEWGKLLDTEKVLETPILARDYVYPLERALRTIVHCELKQHRRVMIYIEQVGKRHIDVRLTRILSPIARAHRTHIWTLSSGVDAREREAAICTAVDRGHQIVLVPYRLIAEGVNLQRHIDTVVWYELARNRFALEQASDRAWRLGRPIDADGTQRPVHIYFLAYAGSAGHKKLRKLAGENGAAQLFAGNTPDGALSHWIGANKTPVARMSASLDEQQESLDLAFQQRAADRRAQLHMGRSLLGAEDTLARQLQEYWMTPLRSSTLWGLRRAAAPATAQASEQRSGLKFGESVNRKRPRQATQPQDPPTTSLQLSLFDG
jgi:hypothetical protein